MKIKTKKWGIVVPNEQTKEGKRNQFSTLDVGHNSLLLRVIR